MQRRTFISLLGSAASWPLAAHAQQKPMPMIGFLSSTSPDLHPWLQAAFQKGLGETGYVEGQNVAIEYRSADGHFERLPALAADLVNRRVDLIATGGTPGAPAAKSATSTIPIVFATGEDPVETGLVASLARPGGNLTGLSFGMELTPKRFELLSELVPQAAVIAVLANPTMSNSERVIMDVQKAARAKGVRIHILRAATDGELEAAFAPLAQLHADGLVVAGNPFFTPRRKRLVALASHHGVPAIYFEREYVDDGGLMSYGTSLTAVFHKLGVYAGKILKGAKPGDLPVEQPTKFELVINLKTAKALGLTVPQSLLARADEVIE